MARSRVCGRALGIRGILLYLLLACVASEDLYEALGVPRSATDRELRSAYRKLALKHHPDKAAKGSADSSSADRFIGISRAYEVLSDKEKRAVYDKYGEDGLRRMEAGAPPSGPASFGGAAGAHPTRQGARMFVFEDAESLFRHFFGVEEEDEDGEAAAHWASPPGSTRSASSPLGSSRLSQSRFAGGASSRPAQTAGGEWRAGGARAQPAHFFARGSAVRHAGLPELQAIFGQPAARDRPPVRLLVFYSPAALAASPLLIAMADMLEEVAAVTEGIVEVFAVDADAERDAAISLGVRALPALQAISAGGRRLALQIDGGLSAHAIGRFALMALDPGSVPVGSEAELEAFRERCASARCGCALLLPARDEASPLWHALGLRLGPDWQLAHAHDGAAADAAAAWAHELGADASVGVLRPPAGSRGARFAAKYAGPPAYGPLRSFLDGECAARAA